MGSPAFIIVSLVLFLFSVYIGFTVGQAAGAKVPSTRAYWMANGAAIVAAVLLTLILSQLPLLYAAIVGLLAGVIAGLKMGFGESVGPWRKHDEAFNVNRAQRDAADKGTAAARRRRRSAGEREPDLISTETGNKKDSR